LSVEPAKRIELRSHKDIILLVFTNGIDDLSAKPVFLFVGFKLTSIKAVDTTAGSSDPEIAPGILINAIHFGLGKPLIERIRPEIIKLGIGKMYLKKEN
jgi:hypothetical protein